MKLVIVESPAKAKTIGQILGRGYRVRASMGHIRDLPRKEMGVDIDNEFKPQYVTARGKQKTIKSLREAASSAQAVYLATDLDREGEAIAWHVLQAINRTLPKGTPVHRATFHEITRGAITTAMQQAGSLNQALVEAQQTRRILDRLVGYSISPLLWERICGAPSGLSAGRVQTVALRLVVDREREIEAFEPVEYWSIAALLKQQKDNAESFLAKLWRISGKDPDLKNRDDAQAIVDALESASYWIDKAERKRKSRRPPAPFTTSTMQQAASSRLKFAPSITMKIAQQLYEGVELGSEGQVGLITRLFVTDLQEVAKVLGIPLWSLLYPAIELPDLRSYLKVIYSDLDAKSERTIDEIFAIIKWTERRRRIKASMPYQPIYYQGPTTMPQVFEQEWTNLVMTEGNKFLYVARVHDGFRGLFFKEEIVPSNSLCESDIPDCQDSMWREGETQLGRFLQENGYCWQVYPTRIHHDEYCRLDHQAILRNSSTKHRKG